MATLPTPEPRRGVEYHGHDFAFEEHAAALRESLGEAVDPAPAGPSRGVAAESEVWEAFHSTHATGRFFQPKRVVVGEFATQLATARRVLDVGCGNGSTAIAIASALPVVVTAIDTAPSAVRLCQAAADAAGVPVSAAVCDVCDPEFKPPASCDTATCVFVLSAVPQEFRAAALGNVVSCVEGGGRVLFRDYGIYDMAHMRFARGGTPMESCGEHGSVQCRRPDGTLAVFFSVEDVCALFGAAGLEVEEAEYHTVINSSRKREFVMKRVFVHCVGRKRA